MTTIREATETDQGALQAIIAEAWGDTFIMIQGEAIYPMRIPALIAESSSQIVGALTYRISDDICEIVTLDAIIEGAGIGTELLDALKEIAEEAGCARITAVTTNDNLDALRFYQRRGFELVRIYRNSVEGYRDMKPVIPQVGRYGIPVRDELELEFLITNE